MSILVTADIHMTESEQDSYRWGLWPWMKAQIKPHKVRYIAILGDLTEAKDRHSSRLVNQLVDNAAELVEEGVELIFDMGNHDRADPQWPFFKFLTRISKKRVRFIHQPTSIRMSDSDKDADGRALFLPHTDHWEDEWKGIDFTDFNWIFTHQTYSGVKAENGFVLEGVPPTIFARTKASVWSGDIHGPQMVTRNVGYVGSPYRCRFGDTSNPRILLLKNGKEIDLHFPCPMKHLVEVGSVRDLARLKYLRRDDQVKVRVNQSRAEMADWPRLKAEIVALAAERGWALYGPDPALIKDAETEPSPEAGGLKSKRSAVQVLDDYADRNHLSKASRSMGRDLLDGSRK